MRAECEKHNTSTSGSCSRNRWGTGAACVTLFDTLRTYGPVVPPISWINIAHSVASSGVDKGLGREVDLERRLDGGVATGGALRYHESQQLASSTATLPGCAESVRVETEELGNEHGEKKQA